MEISLIRHGRSTHTENEKISCLQFQEWVRNYDAKGVMEESTYPSETVEKVKNAPCIITSDLQRAVQSANLLYSSVETVQSPIFRETELLIFSMKVFRIMKLRPHTWAVILRLLWFCGFANKCESLSKARVRAKEAAQQLVDYTGEYESVVLVGHGFFNRLVAKELQKQGWISNRKMSARHWSCTTYTLSEKSNLANS